MDIPNSVCFKELCLTDEHIPLLFPFYNGNLHRATRPVIGQSIGTRIKSFDFDEAIIDGYFVEVACSDHAATKLDQTDSRKWLIVRAKFLRSLFCRVSGMPNGFDGLSTQCVISCWPSRTQVR